MDHPARATAHIDDPESIVSELFLTPEGRRNPYPLYHRLREASPVHRSEKLGVWLLCRYQDCRAALRDPRLGKNYARTVEERIGPDWRRHPSLTSGEHSMLNVNGPAHTRLRRLVVKAFNRRTIDAMRPSIARAVDELLDPMATAGGGEILEALAFPLPVTVIGEMLGVPAPDRAQFRTLVRDLVAIFEMRPTAEQLAAADASQLTIRSYFHALVAEKRRRPTDDILGRLVRAEDEGDRLSDDELVTLASLLFAAGFETTTNLIGNGLVGLLAHGNQLELLRADASLLDTLPDELLRWDGTAQAAVRFTDAPVEVGGTTIPAGETVFALLGAGNHDPAEFPDPDRLDVTRRDVAPLSFGGGVHYCLGALLAQVEIEITFRRLLDRFRTIELVGEPPRFRDRLTLRGLESLHVALRPWAARQVAVVAPRATPERAPVTQRPATPVRAGDAVLALRPAAGPDGTDGGWREALRARTERAVAGDDGLPTRTGPELGAMLALLRRVTLFRGCTEDELTRLAATAYPVSFDPGERLCVEGAEASESYVIAEGEAAVTIGGREVARVGEDRVVGERGPLEDRRRTATVTALTPMVTYGISRPRLLDLVTGSPSAADAMYGEMRERYDD